MPETNFVWEREPRIASKKIGRELEAGQRRTVEASAVPEKGVPLCERDRLKVTPGFEHIHRTNSEK
jgi:hypothetical protein